MGSVFKFEIGGTPASLARNSAAAEKRGRAKIPGGHSLSNPLPFCPPELKSFSKFSVRIFAKKSSDFVQRSEPE